MKFPRQRFTVIVVDVRKCFFSERMQGSSGPEEEEKEKKLNEKIKPDVVKARQVHLWSTFLTKGSSKCFEGFLQGNDQFHLKF